MAEETKLKDLEAGDENRTEIYKVLGQDVTKEQYDQVGEWQKLSLNGRDLYKMYMEKKGLDPDTLLPSDEHRKVMDALINQGYLEDKEDPFKNFGWDEKAGGGMMDINRMTAPLGYDTGGPVPRHRQKKEMTIDSIISDAEASKGPGEQGMISKAIYKLAGDPVIDPMFTAKEKIKDFGRTGIETLKKLGSGAMDIGQELLGAGSVEASEVGLTETLRLLKLQLMLEKGMPGSVLMPSGDPNKIKRLEDKIQQIEIELGE